MRGDHNFIRGIPGTTDCEYRIRFKCTKITIWIWASTSHHSPSLNDLNLPPYPFYLLNTMAAIRPNEKYSPQSPDPSNQSSTSTSPMYVSTIEGWQTSHTTTDDAIFYPENEPRRVYRDICSIDTFDSNEHRPVSFISSPSSTPPSPRR